MSSYSERTFEDPLTLCILKMVTKDCYKSSIPLYWCKPQKLFQFSFVRILKASGYKLLTHDESDNQEPTGISVIGEIIRKATYFHQAC